MLSTSSFLSFVNKGNICCFLFQDAPSLEVFKVRLNGASSNLVYQKVSLPMAGEWELDDLYDPFIHSQIILLMILCLILRNPSICLDCTESSDVWRKTACNINSQYWGPLNDMKNLNAGLVNSSKLKESHFANLCSKPILKIAMFLFSQATY